MYETPHEPSILGFKLRFLDNNGIIFLTHGPSESIGGTDVPSNTLFTIVGDNGSRVWIRSNKAGTISINKDSLLTEGVLFIK